MKIEKIVTGILEENCYVLSQDDVCLVIDPGDDSAKIKKVIGTKKILAVLVTHVHFDHIGALRDFLLDNKHLSVLKKSNLEDQKEYQLGPFTFQVLYTPGHSRDSITFYFEKSKAMFTGDFLFRDVVGRCDLPTGDSKEMEASLRYIKTYNDNIKIYSGHGGTTTLGREKKENLYLGQIK